jgi:hypothetical protein
MFIQVSGCLNLISNQVFHNDERCHPSTLEFNKGDHMYLCVSSIKSVPAADNCNYQASCLKFTVFSLYPNSRDIRRHYNSCRQQNSSIGDKLPSHDSIPKDLKPFTLLVLAMSLHQQLLCGIPQSQSYLFQLQIQRQASKISILFACSAQSLLSNGYMSLRPMSPQFKLPDSAWSKRKATSFLSSLSLLILFLNELILLVQK